MCGEEYLGISAAHSTCDSVTAISWGMDAAFGQLLAKTVLKETRQKSLLFSVRYRPVADPQIATATKATISTATTDTTATIITTTSRVFYTAPQ